MINRTEKYPSSRTGMRGVLLLSVITAWIPSAAEKLNARNNLQRRDGCGPRLATILSLP